MSRPLYVRGDRLTVLPGGHTEGPESLRLLVTEEVAGPYTSAYVRVHGVPLGDDDAVVGAPVTVWLTPARTLVDS